MTVCRYYQQGRCKFGDNCKYEHIDPPGGNQQQHHQSRNGRNNNNQSDPFSKNGQSGGFRKKGQDHNNTLPKWPLSVIANQQNMDEGNALSGDMSPEELRVLAYGQAPRGISPEVQQREGQMVSEHQAKVDALLRGGMQMSTGNGIQPSGNDPFAQGNSGSGFSGGFSNQNQQQGFAQPQANNPFGNGTPQQTSNPFGQVNQQQAFTPTQPQQQSFVQPPQQQMNPSPQPISNAAQEQFSAAQFGFANVPETAPPPQFY